MKTQYTIGEVIYWNGSEVEIVSGPYRLYGGSWQDAIVRDPYSRKYGKQIAVKTPSIGA